ncbi:MAG: hypothetical protein HYW48_00635 [Deltaproteobacteria bacterium]|nr:hypothetical protein [Deltaproteobacteria bacterium]
MIPVHEIVLDFISRIRIPVKGLLFVLAFSFVLALIASLFLSRIFLPQVSTRGIFERPAMVVIEREASTLNPNSIKEIVDRNIFNKEGKVPKEDALVSKEKGPAGVEAIKSDLPLKLTGTIYGGNPQAGLAVIENTEAKKQNSFLVGDRVMDKVTVAEIHRYKVILQVADHKEYIELEEKIIERGKRAKDKKGKVAALSGMLQPGAEKFSEEGFERDGAAITMSSDYRQKLLSSDFAKILQDAKAEPFLEGGELSGFQLRRIKPDSIYMKAGLIDGDIIKEINGVSLVDTAQTIKLLNSLRGANEMEFSLVRGGKKMTIQLQVK